MGVEKKPDLGLEKWKEFLTDLNTNLKHGGTKIKEIILSGGEPTLLSYFVELSNWILDQGWYFNCIKDSGVSKPKYTSRIFSR